MLPVGIEQAIMLACAINLHPVEKPWTGNDVTMCSGFIRNCYNKKDLKVPKNDGPVLKCRRQYVAKLAAKHKLGKKASTKKTDKK